MSRTVTTHSKMEKWLGFVILLVLAGIGTGIVLVQFRYNPAVLTVHSMPSWDASHPPVSEKHASGSVVSLPKGIAALSPPAVFEPHNVSDKIDGKADLYLSSGFVRLRCQRFMEIGHPDQWMELFAYDMGNEMNAFAVYSSQKRKDVEGLDIAPYSYSTENALFFAHGSYYVEIIGSAATEKTFEAMKEMAKNFIHDKGSRQKQISEMALFPRSKLDENSISLIISDAFGCDRLDRVFTAIYRLNDTETTAFLSRRKTPQEAEQLAQIYHEFLLDYDGKSLESKVLIAGARLVEIMDTYELIFARGPFMAGVREAVSPEQAEALAKTLHQRLGEVSGEK